MIKTTYTTKDGHAYPAYRISKYFLAYNDKGMVYPASDFQVRRPALGWTLIHEPTGCIIIYKSSRLKLLPRWVEVLESITDVDWSNPDRRYYDDHPARSRAIGGIVNLREMGKYESA